MQLRRARRAAMVDFVVSGARDGRRIGRGGFGVGVVLGVKQKSVFWRDATRRNVPEGHVGSALSRSATIGVADGSLPSIARAVVKAAPSREVEI